MSRRELSKREGIVFGLIALATGIGTAAIIYLQPQQLRAPAWVAYAAASTFAFAGIALIAGALGAQRVVAWIGPLVVGALLVPGLWVALGSGGRTCSFSFGGLRGAASEWLCRGAFGAGSLLALALLFLLVRRALSPDRGKRKAPGAADGDPV